MACDITGMPKLCLLVMIAIHAASGFVRLKLIPFGKRAGDNELFGDDTSSDPINIGPFKYFGSVYSELYVNTNGALSFGKNAKCRALTRSNFPKKRGTPPIITPFWNDIDITDVAYDGYLFGGNVWYRQSTDRRLLKKVSTEIGKDWFAAAWMFVATWHEVQFHGAKRDDRYTKNSFQVVLATDEKRERSYAIFNYVRMDWASIDNGLNGTSRGVAGFDSGDGTNFVELPGSFTDDVRRLPYSTNVGIRGKWIFNIDKKPVKDPDPPPATTKMPDNWITDIYTGKQYIRLSMPRDVDRLASQEACKKIGGVLPEPKNSQENDFLASLQNAKYTWLGLSDDKEEGNWVWDQDGAPVDWTKWDDVIWPIGGRDENCAYLKSWSREWNDRNCEESLSQWGVTTQMCEKARSGKPEWRTDHITKKHYIDLMTPWKSHAESQEACKIVGGFLPEPKNVYQNDFLASMTGSIFWLGMRYEQGSPEGIWKWDYNGDRVAWFNWATSAQQRASCAYVARDTRSRDGHVVKYTRKPSDYVAGDTRSRAGHYKGWLGRDCDKSATEHEHSTIVCEKEWRTDPITKKHYIDLMKPWMTQAESQETCKIVGGFLPEPKNEKENDFLASMTGSIFWLGMTHKQGSPEGVWKWDYNGEKVEWFHWATSAQHRVSCAYVARDTRSRDGHHKGWLGRDCDKSATEQEHSTIVCEKGTFKTDPISGKRYIVLNTPGKSHGSGQEACKDLGGFLPQPKSRHENDFLANMTTRRFRLGLRYDKTARRSPWRWDHGGTKATWFNWVFNPGHPRENFCFDMVRGYYGRDNIGWLNVACNSTNGSATVVCEKDPEHPGAGRGGIAFALSAGDYGKLQPLALLMSVALELSQLVQYM